MSSNATHQREWTRRRRREALGLLGGRCVRCGATENLEFDHIDPATKSFSIGEFGSHSWADILTELKKCQLLCNACHIDKTWADQRASRQHGTWAMYSNAGCRCDECREFFNAYRRELRRRKNAILVTAAQ